MKRLISTLLALTIVISLFSGIGMSASALSGKDSAYQTLIARYKDAINCKFDCNTIFNGANNDGMLNRELCYSMQNSNNFLYYALIDLNNDNVNELLLGYGNDKSQTKTLADLFTYSGNRCIRLFTFDISWRCGFKILNDNKIYYYSSGSAYYGSNTCYYLPKNADSLYALESFGYSKSTYSEPYSYFSNRVTNGVVDYNKTQSISESKFNALINKYTNEKTTFNWQKIDGSYFLRNKLSGFKCTARSATAQTVSWKKVSGASGYQVQCSDGGTKWAQTKSGKGNSATFKGLSAGKQYKFRVRAYVDLNGKRYYGVWSSTLTSPTLPSGTSLTKLTGAKKAFTAQWKKAGFTGYQIQYSTNASFSGAKKVTVKGAKNLKATVKSLSAKKTYYVRIRTYKTIGSTHYMSAWSNTYKVKTK